MRTTINIDDEVLEFAQAIASYQGISLGDAVSRLALCGMRAPLEEMERDPVSGVFVFKTKEIPAKVSSEDVKKAIEREYEEEYQAAVPKA
jgi:hypothetical protein